MVDDLSEVSQYGNGPAANPKLQKRLLDMLASVETVRKNFETTQKQALDQELMTTLDEAREARHRSSSAIDLFDTMNLK